MAIEASDTNQFIGRDKIQTYLRGRKEQAMRLSEYRRESGRKSSSGRCGKNFRRAGILIQFYLFKKSSGLIPACFKIALNVPSGISPG